LQKTSYHISTEAQQMSATRPPHERKNLVYQRRTMPLVIDNDSAAKALTSNQDKITPGLLQKFLKDNYGVNVNFGKVEMMLMQISSFDSLDKEAHVAHFYDDLLPALVNAGVMARIYVVAFGTQNGTFPFVITERGTPLLDYLASLKVGGVLPKFENKLVQSMLADCLMITKRCHEHELLLVDFLYGVIVIPIKRKNGAKDVIVRLDGQRTLVDVVANSDEPRALGKTMDYRSLYNLFKNATVDEGNQLDKIFAEMIIAKKE
jgi:hypothetical protein